MRSNFLLRRVLCAKFVLGDVYCEIKMCYLVMSENCNFGKELCAVCKLIIFCVVMVYRLRGGLFAFIVIIRPLIVLNVIDHHHG